jgi:hypothetical protein
MLPGSTVVVPAPTLPLDTLVVKCSEARAEMDTASATLKSAREYVT